MSEPKVSVVMAVKNEELHIVEAVTTVAQQEVVSHEIIVVDDGSTDRTLELLNGLAKKFPNVRLHKNPKGGKVSAFNFGVSQARGDLVCLFAGDDIMPAGSLAARVAAISHLLPSEKPVVGLSKIQTMSDNAKYDWHLVPRRKGRSSLSGVSPLMNKACVGRIFPIPSELPNEDTWMEIAILHSPGVVVQHSDIICCKWRMHAGNSINTALPFVDYNVRYTARMRAHALFMERYGEMLESKSRALLQGKIDCERRRVEGKPLKILATSAGLVDRARAIALSGPMLYGIRNRLYGLLSGW